MTTIPKDSFNRFAAKLIKELSGDYSTNKIDQVERLSRQLAGWANFYQFTDYTATVYSKLDSIIFWKFAGHTTLGELGNARYRAVVDGSLTRSPSIPVASR